MESKTEQRIALFCMKHCNGYSWQALRAGARRAMIESRDRVHHAALMQAAQRLKGVTVSDWTCTAGGVWEGRVYLCDTAEYERVKETCNAETARVNNWWMIYHETLVNGGSREQAIQEAEKQFPTPA